MRAPSRGFKARATVAALAATAAMVMASLPSAQPARADNNPAGPVLGVLGKIIPFVSYAQTAYGLADKYVFSAHDPTLIQQIQALIQASSTDIKNQVDADAAAETTGHAGTVIEQFESFDTLGDGDALKAFVRDAVDVVEVAKAQINNVSSLASVDELAFDLNIIGPIALTASAKANQSTTTLRADIIAANQKIVQRLTPTCGVYTPNPSPGTVLGQGHCFAYNSGISAPSNPATSVPLNISSVGTGSSPWTVHGTMDGSLNVHFPTGGDFSQASLQAASTTSYPIAQGALLTMLPGLNLDPQGAPVALTAETAANQAGAPLGVVGTNGPGDAFRAHLNPDAARPGNAAFVPFTGFDTLHEFRSVATGVNFDGRVEVFAIDRIGQLWHRFQIVAGADSSFSPWAKFDSSTFVSVSVARNQNGALQVFATNASGQAFTRTQVVNSDTFPTPASPKPAVNTWTPWAALTNGWVSQVTAATNSLGRIELFGLGIGGVLFQRQELKPNASDPSTAGNWSEWAQVNHAPAHLREISVTTAPASGKALFLAGLTDSFQLFEAMKLTDTFSDADFTHWGQVSASIRHIAVGNEAGNSGAVQMIGTNASGTVLRNSAPGTVGGSIDAVIPTPPSTGWTTLPGQQLGVFTS
jgi:hypothetical protein